VVDDDREVTHLLAEAFQDWGYIVLQASSAAEATRLAREETLDAALIDVRMPGEDGFRLLQRLKEDNEHLVAVMMTGYASLEGARRAMRLGAYDYITKPFEMGALRAILNAGLKESANARTRGPRKVASPTVLTTPDP